MCKQTNEVFFQTNIAAIMIVRYNKVANSLEHQRRDIISKKGKRLRKR